MKKGRTSSNWALRVLIAVVLVALGLVAGALIRGNNGATVASAPASTTIQAPTIAGNDPRIVAGCESLTTASDQIAAVDGGDNAGVIPTSTSAWRSVSTMADVRSPSAYRHVADDAQSFTQASVADQTSGDLAPAEAAVARMMADCRSLGLPTS